MKYLWGISFSLLVAVTACKSSQSMLADHVPEGFSLSIEKSPCFGTCPAFKMTISDEGLVNYEGKMHVDLIGTYQKQLSTEKMVALTELMMSSQFWQYDTLYDDPAIMDLPRTVVACSDGKRSHQVLSRVGGPQALRYLVETVMAIVGEEGFEEAAP